jgi:hypothetical protein
MVLNPSRGGRGSTPVAAKRQTRRGDIARSRATSLTVSNWQSAIRSLSIALPFRPALPRDEQDEEQPSVLAQSQALLEWSRRQGRNLPVPRLLPASGRRGRESRVARKRITPVRGQDVGTQRIVFPRACVLVYVSTFRYAR